MTFLTIYYCRQVLKNGVVLCQLMNKISPGAITKFKTSGPAFLLMENIAAFQVGREISCQRIVGKRDYSLTESRQGLRSARRGDLPDPRPL